MRDFVLSDTQKRTLRDFGTWVESLESEFAYMSGVSVKQTVVTFRTHTRTCAVSAEVKYTFHPIVERFNLDNIE